MKSAFAALEILELLPQELQVFVQSLVLIPWWFLWCHIQRNIFQEFNELWILSEFCNRVSRLALMLTLSEGWTLLAFLLVSSELWSPECVFFGVLYRIPMKMWMWSLILKDRLSIWLLPSCESSGNGCSRRFSSRDHWTGGCLTRILLFNQNSRPLLISAFWWWPIPHYSASFGFVQRCRLD